VPMMIGSKADSFLTDIDGLKTPRPATPSTPKVAIAESTGVEHHEKGVKFDLDPPQSESSGAHGHEYGENGTKDVRRRHGRRQNNRDRSRHDKSPSSDDSSDTIEEPDLTDRFDEQGRPRGEDALAAGRGATGRRFHSFMGSVFFPSFHSRT
jgi:hypothetical protein